MVGGLRIVDVGSPDAQCIVERLAILFDDAVFLIGCGTRTVVGEFQIVERLADVRRAVIDLVRILADAEEHLAAINLASVRHDLRRAVARHQRTARRIDQHVVVAVHGDVVRHTPVLADVLVVVECIRQLHAFLLVRSLPSRLCRGRNARDVRILVYEIDIALAESRLRFKRILALGVLAYILTEIANLPRAVVLLDDRLILERRRDWTRRNLRRILEIGLDERIVARLVPAIGQFYAVMVGDVLRLHAVLVLLDVRRGEPANVMCLIELDIACVRRDDTFIAYSIHEFERAAVDISVLDGILRAIVNLVGRSRTRRIELRAHDARRDAARAEHGVGLHARGKRRRRQLIVPLLDGISRLPESVLHEFAVCGYIARGIFDHAARGIPRHIGVSQARGLVEELRRIGINREVNAVVLEHLRRLFVRNVQLGAKLLLLFRQFSGAQGRRGQRRRAVVDLAVGVRLHIDLPRRDHRPESRRIVGMGIGRGITQAEIGAARILRKLPILVASAFGLVRPRLIAVDALEFVDDVFVQCIHRIGTVFHISIALAVVRMSAREILVVRTVALVVALLIAVQRIVELDGTFTRAEIDTEFELVVESLLALRAQRLAVDLGERIAVVRLGEVRAVLQPRLLEVERQRLDDTRAVDGVVAVVEVVVCDGTGRLQAGKGILDARKLDVARLGRTVEIALRTLDMLVDSRIARRVKEGAFHSTVAVASRELPSEGVGPRICGITEVEEPRVTLCDAVELQTLLHSIRDIGVAVVVLTPVVRLRERQLLLPDVAETVELVPVMHRAVRGIDERRSLRRSGLQRIARRIDNANLECVVLVRCIILEAHLVGDVLVRRLNRPRVMRVTVRVSIRIFARRVEVELLTMCEAAVLVAADLAVAVERDDLLPVEVRIVLDKLARLLILRIVAILDVLRAVIDLLHEVERQRHAPTKDLTAPKARRIAVVVLAEAVDAIGAERRARQMRVVEIAVA